MSEAARVYEPTAAGVAAAHVSGMDAYRALCAEAEADYAGYWARLARELVSWKTPVHPGAGREQRAVLQVVRRRHAERLLQLPGPQRRAWPGRQDRHHLRGRRRQRQQGQLQRAAGHGGPLCQRAEGAWREEGRRRRHLHADERGGRGRDAGLRAHRRHALGGVRRFQRAKPARPHRRRRRGDGDHRRRAGARRQTPAAEGHRRRSAGDARHRRRSRT